MEAEAQRMSSVLGDWISRHDNAVARLALSPSDPELGRQIVFLAAMRTQISDLTERTMSEAHRVSMELGTAQAELGRLRKGRESLGAWHQKLKEKREQLAAARTQLDLMQRESDECVAMIRGWEDRIRQIDETYLTLREQGQELESRRLAIEKAIADRTADVARSLNVALKESLELNRSEIAEVRKKGVAFETERGSLTTIILREKSRLDPKQKDRFNLKNLAEPIEILSRRIAELEQEQGALEAKVITGEMRLRELEGE